MPSLIKHIYQNGIEVKRCSTCTEWKPLDEYTSDKPKPDGLCHQCIPCLRQYRKERAEKDKEYRKNNRDKVNAWKRNERHRKLESPDEKFIQRQIKENLARRLRLLLEGQKSQNTMDIIGCSAEELKKHLESTWSEGMSWDNYGVHGWHIDHRLPCASFDHSDRVQINQCWNWTNLQAMWAEDNLKKGARIVE